MEDDDSDDCTMILIDDGEDGDMDEENEEEEEEPEEKEKVSSPLIYTPLIYTPQKEAHAKHNASFDDQRFEATTRSSQAHDARVCSIIENCFAGAHIICFERLYRTTLSVQSITKESVLRCDHMLLPEPVATKVSYPTHKHRYTRMNLGESFPDQISFCACLNFQNHRFNKNIEFCILFLQARALSTRMLVLCYGWSRDDLQLIHFLYPQFLQPEVSCAPRTPI